MKDLQQLVPRLPEIDQRPWAAKNSAIIFHSMQGERLTAQPAKLG
jgi:hypothetical protein